MSYLDDLRKEAKDVLWDDATTGTAREAIEAVPEATGTAAIVRDDFDEIAFDVLQKQTRPLQSAVQGLVTRYDDAAGDLYQDVFNVLSQGDPLLEDASKIAQTHQINRSVMEQLAASDEMEALRKDTRYDRFQTLFTMLTMKEQIEEAYSTIYQAAEQEKQTQQELQDAAAGNDPNALANAIAAARAAQGASHQAAQNAANALAAGAKQAKADIDTTNDQLGGYGLGEGELEHLDYEDRRKLVERLNANRMEKLANLIGSFRSFAKGERRKKVKHAPAEQYEYILSNDLTRLVPEELNNLADPTLEDMFWLRWAGHALLTRQVKGPAKAGQGPIIVLCDESGSMGSRLGNGGETREMWSKAVALALCDAAAKGKRDFTYIGFSHVWEQHYEVHFPKGKTNLADVVTFTEHFINGGTDPKPAMAWAYERVVEYDRRDYNKPDIVVISDGDFHLEDDFVKQWLEVMARVDAKTYGIQIGDDGYGSSLPAVCDHIVNIDTLNASADGVQKLFAEI